MTKFSEYMNVSRRGNIPTRYFVRPLASMILSLLPPRIEKILTPNIISLIAFLVSALGNLWLFTAEIENNKAALSVAFTWFLFQYFAYLLDCADGQFARMHNLTSESGKVVDMLFDLAREIFKLFIFYCIFQDSYLIAFVIGYFLLRILWISSWAPIQLLDKPIQIKKPEVSHIQKNLGKGLTLNLISLSQDGLIDVIFGSILLFHILSSNFHPLIFQFLFSFFAITIIVNLALVARRILVND